MAAVTSHIGGAHPVTLPAFEERACQHKCCHDNGNESTTNHGKRKLENHFSLVSLSHVLTRVNISRRDLPLSLSAPASRFTVVLGAGFCTSSNEASSLNLNFRSESAKT